MTVPNSSEQINQTADENFCKALSSKTKTTAQKKSFNFGKMP